MPGCAKAYSFIWTTWFRRFRRRLLVTLPIILVGFRLAISLPVPTCSRAAWSSGAGVVGLVSFSPLIGHDEHLGYLALLPSCGQGRRARAGGMGRSVGLILTCFAVWGTVAGAAPPLRTISTRIPPFPHVHDQHFGSQPSPEHQCLNAERAKDHFRAHEELDRHIHEGIPGLNKYFPQVHRRRRWRRWAS